MKKNKLTTAIIAGITGVAGIASISNAVNVNPEGLGQTLIYPYYTVNNGLMTLFSVVNTTEYTKAVKVRFLEGDNSLEVLDFNLYLSPFDVWTAGIQATISAGEGHDGEPTGRIVFSDTSCTPFLNTGQQFLPYVIDTDLDDDNKNMERSTSGHFEIIEMGTLDPDVGYGADAVHVVATGIPADCGQFVTNWVGGGVWDAPTGGDPEVELMPVSGGLFGSASIINVAEGIDVAYNAVAIQNFWTAGTIQHTEPGSVLPSLASGDSNSIVYMNGLAVSSSWGEGFEAVSAVFMQDELYNEYALDDSINAKTEWVVTFPTKRFHVNQLVVVPPFTELWDGVEACEPYGLTTWDREENNSFCDDNPDHPLCDGGGISPTRPGTVSTPIFCQETNVLEFLNTATPGDASAILGDTNLATVQTFENGWARLSFGQSTTSNLTGAGFDGLPVTGFAVQQYSNSNAQPGLLAQYAGLFMHKGRIVSNSGTPPVQ